MWIDRIVIDILGWVKNLLWKEQRQQTRSSILETHTCFEATDGKKIYFDGTLQLLERRTPRSVRTWRYLPRRTTSKGQRDILLCLDSLNKLANERTEDGISAIKTARSKGNTHRITVLSASHFLGPDGEFDADELFSGYFSFRSIDRWAIAALDDLAFFVPFEWERSEGNIQWEREIVRSRISKWTELRR